MPIAATGGTAASNGSAVASLALPSYTTHTGQDLVFNIILGSTASSVTSISNSAGTYGSVTKQITINGSGLRLEKWTMHVSVGAATVFTINIGGGNTTISCELEEYNGVNAFGNVAAASGSGILPNVQVISQDNNNWVEFGIGWACQPTDTVTPVGGGSQVPPTNRQTSVPAATAVAGNMSDQFASGNCTFWPNTKINTVAPPTNWVCAAIELRSGTGTTSVYAGYPSGASGALLDQIQDFQMLNINAFPLLINPTGTQSPIWGTFTMPDGYVAQAYFFDWYLELVTTPTLYTVLTGSLPPGLALNNLGNNQGSITGTPTVQGTYNFTLRATNSVGIADKAFTIVIHAATGGGGSFTYVM